VCVCVCFACVCVTLRAWSHWLFASINVCMGSRYVCVCVCIAVCDFFGCVNKTKWIQALCAFIHTCIYTYIHTYPTTCIRAFNAFAVHRFPHTYTHRPACIHTFIHTYTHTHTYKHSHIHAHMHTYMNAYMHTYIHAYIHTASPELFSSCAHVGNLGKPYAFVRCSRVAHAFAGMCVCTSYMYVIFML
jgi:hypothetical protein